MKKLLLVTALLVGVASASQAGVRFSFGLPLPPLPFLSAPAPVYRAPVYDAPCYDVPPPVCYDSPRVVIEPPVYFGYGSGDRYYHRGYAPRYSYRGHYNHDSRGHHDYRGGHRR